MPTASRSSDGLHDIVKSPSHLDGLARYLLRKPWSVPGLLGEEYPKMRIRVLALICSFSVILSTVFAGCGGGGGGDAPPAAQAGAPADAPPAPSSEDTSDATTRQNLQSTNLDVPPAVGMLKRWSLPIPVQTNGDARAVQAMDMIEKRLGTTIFARNADTSTRGLVISVGTAQPQSSLCSGADPYVGGSAEITARLFIHLDSASAECIASLDATIHQFGHTLGTLAHFQNFGNGQPIGELFWRVLRTIYLNPIGTTTANIVLAP
jgi:hypothetical protein